MWQIFISLFFSISLLSISCSSVSASGDGKTLKLNSGFCGDVNNDNTIDLTDLILVLRTAANENDAIEVSGDCDGNGRIDMVEALEILTGHSAQRHDFVNFKGADEDKELVDELISKYLTVNEPKRIIYVAPYTEQNNVDGTGETKDSPRRNLRDALEHAQAGDHFYLAPGVYEVDKTQKHFDGSDNKAYFTLGNSGTVADKIVVTTDPDLFDITTGKVAQFDFNFNNIHAGDNWAIGIFASDWVFENLEVRNVTDWGFYVTGPRTLIRNNDIHHLNHKGYNNTALFAFRGAGESNSLVMNNHIHHAGEIDENGDLIDLNNLPSVSENGGCVYDKSPQAYTISDNFENSEYFYIDEKGESHRRPEKWKHISREELSQYMAPADSERYYYNNLFDNCYAYALATKNYAADGPTYFLSNIIHSSYHPIRITVSDSVVRNNIIYPGDNDWMQGEAVKFGWQQGKDQIYANFRNAVGIKVTNNTFVGAPVGIDYITAWDGEVNNNIFLDIPKPHRLTERALAWEGKGTCWLAGEYFYGDLNADHYYYDDMPLALQEQSYRKLKVENDIYMVEPILTGAKLDYLPTKYISDTYQILTSEKVRSNMVDPENNDFRKKANAPALEGIGSGIH